MAAPPAGTDPTLWNVLTTEERNFFAKTAAMGRSPTAAQGRSHPAPPAARGVRLDVAPEPNESPLRTDHATRLDILTRSLPQLTGGDTAP